VKVTHPISGATYERLDDDGRVQVTDRDGITGVFSADGRHISGDLKFADPHVLDWVGGRQAGVAIPGAAPPAE
jgi:hypothetical protein